jgi:hypothetical protein
MKSTFLVAIGLLGSSLFAATLQAGGINFDPALGTYSDHCSFSKNIWWSEYQSDPDGLFLIAPTFVKNDVKFDGQPYARPASPSIDLKISSSEISPDLTAGFFRPAL